MITNTTLQTSHENMLDSPAVLRLLGHVAIRIADGETVTSRWLIQELENADQPDHTRLPSLGSLLTVPEASTQLRISRWSIYDLIHKKQLLSVKIGRRRFVPSSELARYMNSLPLRGGQLL